jgi:hypothetical protein
LSTRSTARLGLGVVAGAVALLVMASPATAATGGWSIVTTPKSTNGNDSLNAVSALTDADAWAVGTTFIPPDPNGVSSLPLALHWNGTAWQKVATPPVTVSSILLGVAASSATDAWAVGRATTGYRVTAPVLLHWNGTAWSTASQPATSGSLNAVAALSSTNAWAVGRSGRFGPQLIEHWDGTQWTVLSAPDPDPTYPAGAQLTAISARAANDIWALGRSSTVGAYALHWNGAAWSLSFLASVSGNLPTSVLALGANDVWATVNTYNGGDAFIEHWNGTAWSVSATRPATEYPTLAGLAARSATDVWAVGGFLGNINTPSPTREVRTLHWTGASWTVVDAPNGGGADISGAAAALGGSRVWVVGSIVLTRTT